MTTYSFGDIVLVSFPFTDQSTIKKRPAVIISSNEYNRNRPDIILMAVTSQIRSMDFYGDLPVRQWQEAGLLKPSVIKPICTTVEKHLILKTLGRLQKQDMTALDEALQIIFGQ
jgi:mRNA interferase MazF